MQKLKEISKTENKGITLIALIITIIVMLILVGVTINVALNGGLFEKAKKATYQTDASTIKEQLEVAKAIKISENKGNVPTDYEITIDNLDISDKLKNDYKDKLIITSNGNLYYDPEIVTDIKEQSWLEEMEIYRLDESQTYGPELRFNIFYGKKSWEYWDIDEQVYIEEALGLDPGMEPEGKIISNGSEITDYLFVFYKKNDNVYVYICDGDGSTDREPYGVGYEYDSEKGLYKITSVGFHNSFYITEDGYKLTTNP